jgi:hypothetical protein
MATTRAIRRFRTELTVARRLSRHRRYDQAAENPHRYHKNDPLGMCGNRHCSVCAVRRTIKRAEKKAERSQGRAQERTNEETT